MKTSLYYKLVYTDFTEFQVNFYSLNFIKLEDRGGKTDSVAYQQGERGGKMREVLKRRTGSVTLPQIFIGGTFEGGCTDVFDSLKSGQLHTRLQKHGVAFDPSVKTNLYELLPKWLHPR